MGYETLAQYEAKTGKAIVVQYGSEALEKRPDLAALAMRILGGWSTVELEMALMTMAFLNSDFRVTLGMLDALRSSGSTRKAVLGAAKARLGDGTPAMDRLEDVFDRLRNITDHRDWYAHHIWGWADDLPTALLLIEPLAILNARADTEHSTRTVARRPPMMPPFGMPQGAVNIAGVNTIMAWMTGGEEYAVNMGDVFQLTTPPAPPPSPDKGLVRICRESDMRQDIRRVLGSAVLLEKTRLALSVGNPGEPELRMIDEALLASQ